MVRQCAWCLCLMNSAGERVSLSPLPKLYKATHGMCCVCGVLWMEQVVAQDVQNLPEAPNTATPNVTELVLQLQQNKRKATKTARAARKGSVRII